ncbi:conjugal transfer protein TrbE [Klebsiella aerogenes]|uniref:conjugal transfer protein TrbE n=1 Tax=Klebsiella aerogenes TaxID=548 RepID=UPI002E309815|nr:conjugal transfer protein TrbE [Klebsiella aerogenes]
MKVIFSSGRVTDFLIRLCLTVIVSSPVIIWSWDTVKQTTGSDIIAAVFFITILGGLWLLLCGFLSSLIDLLKPAGENRTKRKERGE